MATQTIRNMLIGFAAIAAMIAMTPSFGVPWGGEFLIFVVDTPLAKDDAIRRSTTYDIYVDGKKSGCDQEDVDADNGWLCKVGPVAIGKHEVNVKIISRKDKDAGESVMVVNASVVLRAEDKKYEFPGNPSSGDQFWCMLISKEKVTPLPSSDDRCHSD